MAKADAVQTYQHTLADANPIALEKLGTSSGDCTLLALPSNTGSLYVGNSSVSVAEGFPLAPGASRDFSVLNMSSIYVRGTTGDKFAVIREGSN